MATTARSGRIHLVQEGVQDQFFTGSPQVSYFQTVFDSTSSYTLNSFENVPQTKLDFGGTSRIRLVKKGNLVRNITLSCELSEITCSSNINSVFADNLQATPPPAPITSDVNNGVFNYNSLNWQTGRDEYSQWNYFGASFSNCTPFYSLEGSSAGMRKYTFNYDSSTTMGDPGSGEFRLNDFTTQRDTTQIAISTSDVNGTNIGTYLDLLAATTARYVFEPRSGPSPPLWAGIPGTPYNLPFLGPIRLFLKTSDPTDSETLSYNSQNYNISAVTNNGGWYLLTVKDAALNAFIINRYHQTFANTDECTVYFPNVDGMMTEYNSLGGLASTNRLWQFISFNNEANSTYEGEQGPNPGRICLPEQVSKMYLSPLFQMSLNSRSTRNSQSTAYFPFRESRDIINTVKEAFNQITDTNERKIYIQVETINKRQQLFSQLYPNFLPTAIWEITGIPDESEGWTFEVKFVVETKVDEPSGGTSFQKNYFSRWGWYVMDYYTATEYQMTENVWDSTYFNQMQVSFLFTDPVRYYGIGYTNSIGTAMIDHADLLIGGQTIERYNGEMINIYNSYWKSETEQDTFKWTQGLTTSVGGLGVAQTDFTKLNVPNEYPFNVLINLPFTFTQDDSLALPIQSLLYQDVELEISLRKFYRGNDSDSFDRLFYTDKFIADKPLRNKIYESLNANIIKSVVPTEYIYLDGPVASYLQKTQINYPVVQNQLFEERLTNNSPIAEAYDDSTPMTNIIDLNFINPVKEMFFIVQDSHHVDRDDYYNYRLDSLTKSGTGADVFTNPTQTWLKSIDLSFNESNRTNGETTTSSYLYNLARKQHTRVSSNNAASYSFALFPENPYPSGQVNMSRIVNQKLTLELANMRQTNVEYLDVRVYARSYNILQFRGGIAGMLFIDNNKLV